MERPEHVFTAARDGDGEAMRRLARKAYQPYVARIGREPAPMVADYETIAASGDALLVWRENDVVGMLVTRLEAHSLFLENIAVDPGLQGSGLGSRLLAEAERMARRSGADTIRLYTNEAMVENLDFYRRRGYEETHRAVEEGYNRVYFEKRFSGLDFSTGAGP